MFNFNTFSERSIKVVNLAQAEAQRSGHNFIGSEQLLIGLLGVDSSATQLLNAAGVNLEAAQVEVEKIIGRGSGYVSFQAPYTPEAKRAIEKSISIAREQGLRLTEPEHLLLAILDLGEGIILRILEEFGVSVPQLRSTILTQLQSSYQQLTLEQARESENETNLHPSIPPIGRDAPLWLIVNVLPQESGRWVAQVNAGGNVLDGPRFKSIGYGDSDFQAIASALESVARMYRDYQA